MGKIPSWVWVVVAGLAVWVMYQRGVFKTATPPQQKNPATPPATGVGAADIINSAVSGIFGLARNLTAPDTTVKSL